MGCAGKCLTKLWELVGGWRKFLRLPHRQKLEPQEIFSRFQTVLASNTRALEIIADLGEKGSGDFIFDQAYISRTLQQLQKTVRGSVKALNELCANRFVSLEAVLDHLSSQLEQTLSGSEGLRGPLVQGLDHITPGDWGLVGGKAGHLAELRSDGQVQVPSGFVITTHAFHVLIESAGLLELYKSLQKCVAAPQDECADMEEHRLALVAGIDAAQAPPELLAEIDRALAALRGEDAQSFTLAVRSSAPEEDQEFSFAGQFHSELHVQPEAAQVFAAYRLVVASLFSASAVLYHRSVLPGEDDLVIAACCQRMIDSAVSGVAYTLDPGNPLTENMVVVGAWGLGAAVVEGSIATDTFSVRKTPSLAIIDRQVVKKATGFYQSGKGGHQFLDIPAEQQLQPCLQDAELLQLGAQLVHLENRFRRPLDVEWTRDQRGELYILQARPLLVPASRTDRRDLSEQLNRYDAIDTTGGKVAQQGIGCGTVYCVHSTRDLEAFPENGVLVSRRDSSRFVSVMNRAAAIITETGTPVSHMATICREMQVPCLVGIDGIMEQLTPGEEITVDADDVRIYRGRVVELLAYRATSGMQLAVSKEFRLLRRVLKKVSQLNLVDPMLKNFTVAGCLTYHDVLRFVHETAVQELVNLGRDEKGLLRRHLARHLDLPVPVGVIVVDIGGGLKAGIPGGRVDFQGVASRPFRAILQGMLFPGVWHLSSMHVGMHDLMSSMLSAPIAAIEGSYTGHNIAIIGENYVNLCFRLGYHFNIIDAYCSDKERDNHIYFRFLGGASDVSKRTRRAMLIEKILIEFDFRIKIRGDMVIARHSNLIKDDMIRILDILGRLVGFTRQLDVKLDSDAVVDYYAEAFLMGNYEVVANR